jgi:phospholipid/cholesterol/gamma-HCH transport system substrate-binding protein
MERNAHYAAVGLASLLLFFGAVLFFVWLAQFQFSRDYDVYDVRFYGPVRGVSEGGEVHFNGIKVGEVIDLGLEKGHPDRVMARVRMTSDVPVRVDSRAQLEPQGITGVNYIQISSGSPSQPLLKSRYKEGQVPVIESQPSPLTELLEGGGTVLAQAVDALNRINKVLSDENVESFSNTLANVETVSTEMAERRAVLAKAEAAIESANAAAAEIQALSRTSRTLMEGDGAEALARLNRAAAEIESAAVDVSSFVSRVEEPAGDFAEDGLPQLASAAQSLQQSAESLDRLVRETQASPQQMLAKPPAREKEIRP